MHNQDGEKEGPARGNSKGNPNVSPSSIHRPLRLYQRDGKSKDNQYQLLLFFVVWNGDKGPAR